MHQLKLFLLITFFGTMTTCGYAQTADTTRTDKKLEAFLKEDSPVLLEFFATWCGPCRMMTPVMEELEKNWSEKVHILPVDVVKYKELAKKYAAWETPYFVLLVKGKIIWTGEGVMTKKTLEEEIGIALKN